MNHASFNPAPDAEPRLLEAFLDPSRNLPQLAADFGTTLEALSRWLARPETQERLAALDDTNAQRTRMIAAASLPAVAKTLATISADFNAGRLVADSSAPPLGTLRLRASGIALRASSAILRLARFTPGPARARPDRHEKAPEREIGPAAVDSVRSHSQPTAAPPGPEAPARHPPRSDSGDAPDLAPPDIDAVNALLDAQGAPPGPSLQEAEVMLDALITGNSGALPPQLAAIFAALGASRAAGTPENPHTPPTPADTS